MVRYPARSCCVEKSFAEEQAKLKQGPCMQGSITRCLDEMIRDVLHATPMLCALSRCAPARHALHLTPCLQLSDAKAPALIRSVARSGAHYENVLCPEQSCGAFSLWTVAALERATAGDHLPSLRRYACAGRGRGTPQVSMHSLWCRNAQVGCRLLAQRGLHDSKVWRTAVSQGPSLHT